MKVQIIRKGQEHVELLTKMILDETLDLLATVLPAIITAKQKMVQMIQDSKNSNK